MKIGIMGGTFNPIHFGHLRAAEEVREILGLDKVLFVPSGNPPLKTEGLAGSGDRYSMACMAVAGNPFFDVLDIECARAGKSYTVDTVKALKERYPDSRLNFILGIDAFLDLPNWYRPEELVSLVDFIILSRPGTSFADLETSPYLIADKKSLADLDEEKVLSCPLRLRSSGVAVLTRVTPMGISSTGIRRRVKQGLTVKYLLPEDVESFIISNRLYSVEGDAGNQG